MRTGSGFVLFLLFLIIILSSGCNSLSPKDTSLTGDSGTGTTVTVPHPTTASGLSITCPGNPPAFVIDTNVYQTPQIAEPDPRTLFRDPVFGTCLIRVTDRTRDISSEDTSKGLKNEYSRVESFNADGTRILVRGTSATWYLYDARTFTRIEKIPVGTDPRWDALDPELMYFIDGPRLASYNTRTREQRVAHDFSKDFPGQELTNVWTR